MYFLSSDKICMTPMNYIVVMYEYEKGKLQIFGLLATSSTDLLVWLFQVVKEEQWLENKVENKH